MNFFLFLGALLALALGASAFLQYWYSAEGQLRRLSRAMSERTRSDVHRLPRMNPDWQPTDHPGSVEDAVRDLARAGGAMTLAARLFERQLEESRDYGRGGDEVRMAVRYALNATLGAWRGQGREATPAQLRRTLVRAIRDAAALFREERDDHDGLGASTLGQLARALAGGAPVAQSGLQDRSPRPWTRSRPRNARP